MKAPSPNAANAFEKALAYATILLAAMVLAALARGREQLGAIPPVIWLHIASLMVALVLTPVLLLRRRGDKKHRVLGWIWAVAMVITAADSLQVRVINPGHFSVIHILSIVVLITVPLLVFRARKHQVAAHRRGVRIIVTAGILGAGVYAFPVSRLLGHLLFG